MTEKLTSGDLETIMNALSSLGDICERDATSADEIITAGGDNIPAARFLAVAARESARQYRDLARRIAGADHIEVEDA